MSTAATELASVTAPDDELAAQAWFHEQGLTDGLPIIVPTVERVERFLAECGFARDREVGPIEPASGVATVENVAVCAVMAGAKPEHMGVILAALEAMREEPFNLRGVQTTTNPVAALTIVNGPIRHRLGIDGGGHAVSPSTHANGPIGRAIRFALTNIGGVGPEVSRATLGLTQRYTFCLAELEEESPWEPLHVALGYDKDDDVVTLLGPESVIDCCAVWTKAEPIIDQFARLTKSVGTNLNWSMGTCLWVVSPAHARILADAGYTRKSLQEKLFEMSAFPTSDWPYGNWLVGKWVEREDGKVIVTSSPEQIYVMVAGRDDPIHSTYMPPMTFCTGVSKKVWVP